MGVHRPRGRGIKARVVDGASFVAVNRDRGSMIIHGAMTVWLLCLLGEARGVGVDLGGISYGMGIGLDGVRYILFHHNVEGYSMELVCANCRQVDGVRIYCDRGALVSVTVDLRRGGEHVSVPFNVFCDWRRNSAYVRDITASAHPQSMELSWAVSDESIYKYIVHLVAQGEYRYIAVTTRGRSFLLEGLKEGTEYRICMATVDERSEKGGYRCVSAKTTEGRSGKVANLRATTVGARLRVEYEVPPQPHSAVTGYRVTVVLRRGGLCEQVGRTIENTTVTATHHDVPLARLTRCSQYDIAVAPINGWRLEGGVGEPASVVFDYAPAGALPISGATATVVSTNLTRVSWEHRDHQDDCPEIGFLVELANEADAADCVSQVIYNKSCARLTEMVRQASPCAHTETRNSTATGPSWAVTIGAPLGPSRAYAVRIWKISSAVVKQGAPLSLSGSDAGCFTDCYGGTYAGVRSHWSCVAWRHSVYGGRHPSRADSTCIMKSRGRPYCGTLTSYEFCDVPRCSLPSPATGCVRDVRQVTGTSRTTLTWTPPPHGAPVIGVIALLHRDDGTCERSYLHLGAATAGGALGAALKAFFVGCDTTTTARGALNRTVFNNLHHHRRYRVYIVPLVSASQAGEVRNVSVTTPLAKPDHPGRVTVTGRSTTTLAFTWPKVTEDEFNGAADRYEVQLMRSTTVVKEESTTSEGASFSALAECTLYCVTVYGANAAGRSEFGVITCAFTLAPGLGAVEVRDIESGPRGQRAVAWRYKERDACPRSYGLRYWNKFMKESVVTMETNGTSITLGNLARNTLYTVAVRAETRMDTEGGAKEGAFSAEKEFYTGSVVPGIHGYKEGFTFWKERINISWGFDSSGDGSVFEFVLRVKIASDSCISTTHFLCSSCPPPYSWANLDHGNQTIRQRLLSCSPPSVVEFTRDAANLHRSLDIDVASTDVTVEIHAINLVGVHLVCGGHNACREAERGTPNKVEAAGRSSTSITFRWPKMSGDRAPVLYEVQLMKAGVIIKKSQSVATEASFDSLAMCTEYCVAVYRVVTPGKALLGGTGCQYTLAPSRGEIEVDKIEAGPLGDRVVRWRYMGRDNCTMSYAVRYGNKHMKARVTHLDTNGTNVTLRNLDKDAVYTVEVGVQASVTTAGRRKVSEAKEFYTGEGSARIRWTVILWVGVALVVLHGIIAFVVIRLYKLRSFSLDRFRNARKSQSTNIGGLAMSSIAPSRLNTTSSMTILISSLEDLQELEVLEV